MNAYRRLLSGAATRLLVLMLGVVAVAPLPAMSAAPQPAWSTVALAARGFSVSFPVAQPTAKNYLGPRGTLQVWLADTKGGLFIAADMPRAGTPKAAVERLVASLDGKLGAVKTVAIQGAPGAMHYVFSLSSGERGECVLAPVGDHIYGALALTAAKDEAAGSRFVESLAVPAAAKAAVFAPLAGKTRTKPLSAKAFDTGEHLASAFLVDPVDPAVLALKNIGDSAARAGARAGAVRPPVQIALADDAPQAGIPDRKPDTGTSTQQQAAFGAAVASIPAIPASKVASNTPDSKVGATAAPDALALPSLAAGSLARIASRTDVKASPVAAAASQDGIPDPHADVGNQAEGGTSTPQNHVGAAIAPIPDARSGADAMLDDGVPKLDDVDPTPPAALSPPNAATPPSDLQPPRNLLQPPPDLDLPPAADQPPSTTASVPPSPAFANQPPPAAAPYAPPPPLAPQPPASAPYRAPPAFANQPPPMAAPYPAPPALASRLPPAAAPYAPQPARWVWLPDTWRWNGYRWQWLQGRWARAAD